MTRNEFEQLVDRCLAGDIKRSEVYRIIDSDYKKQLHEGEYIYLDNISLRCFEIIYEQGIEDRSCWLLIKQILSGEKSWFSTVDLRMPRENSNYFTYPKAKAEWLLDLVNDSEWTTLRELIIQYRETRFINPEIKKKYWKMAHDDTFKSKTIIDLMKMILYYSLSQPWYAKYDDDDPEGVECFQPGLFYGEEADPVDFTNKLLRIIDFCQGKTFLIVGVNYLNGQPIISLLP